MQYGTATPENSLAVLYETKFETPIWLSDYTLGHVFQRNDRYMRTSVHNTLRTQTAISPDVIPLVNGWKQEVHRHDGILPNTEKEQTVDMWKYVHESSENDADFLKSEFQKVTYKIILFTLCFWTNKTLLRENN
jgi:hypothetical protein